MHSITIGEVAKGRRQFLVYFSTKCAYCLATLPELKKLSAALRSDSARGPDVIWISVSSRDSTRAYVARHAIEYPVAFLPDSKTLRVMRVKGVPLTLVIDHEGHVLHVHASVFKTQSAIDSVIVAAKSQSRMVGANDAPAVAVAR